jgi:protein involved in polysaccharide export with SLBB domain
MIYSNRQAFSSVAIRKKQVAESTGMLKRLISFLFVIIKVAVFSLSAHAVTPTTEQLKLFQNLTPEQQSMLLESVNKKSAIRDQQPLSEYEVVEPKVRSAIPSSTDDEDKEGEAATLEIKQQKKTIKEDLIQFGYDLFAGTPTTFAPATDIPIPVNYVVGPGDTVEIQLFGKDNEQYSLVVTREGVLNFPGTGPISVAGMTFTEMKQNLQQRIKEQMIGVKASITMGVLRSIRVFVLGDAERPGSYTVSSLTTMTNALFVSGGIKPIGSLRNIQLKRNGKIMKRLDLYDLLLKGDTSNDVRLLPGDVIFIPPIGKTVGVSGEVRRPSIYELKGERTVGELVSLAGGLLPTAYPQASQLERIDKNRERTLVDVDLTSKTGRSTRLKSGDIISVYSVLEKMENIVVLSGNVERVGGQQWYSGMRLTDVIPSVKYLLPKSDLNYVLVRREDKATRRIKAVSADLEQAFLEPNSQHNIELFPRDEVIVFSLARSREELIKELLEEQKLKADSENPLQQQYREERIKELLEEESQQAGSEKPLRQQNRAELIKSILDELKLQATSEYPVQAVSIGGRVHSPGEYPLEEKMRISDLIRAAGKLQESAYVLTAEITRYKTINGQYRQAEHIEVDLAAILAGDQQADLELQSHDHLIIKDVPRWSESEHIEIIGEVKFPGTYAVRRGETLSSVLRRAGGITELAFVDGAVFMREELREREQKQMDALAIRLESDIAAASLESTKDKEGAASAQQAVALGKSLVDQLRRTKAAGRLVINLRKILQSKMDVIDPEQENYYLDIENDYLLVKGGDKLVIPRKTQSVTVLGEVHYPTSHLYDDTLGRDEYIGRSGGVTYKADNKRIYIVRANGEVIAGNDSFWSFDDASTEIRPGDTVIVPLDAERIRPLTLWTNVTQILYQVGVAVAAFNSAGIF